MAMVKTWQAHPHIDTLRLSIKGPYGIAIYLVFFIRKITSCGYEVFVGLFYRIQARLASANL